MTGERTMGFGALTDIVAPELLLLSATASSGTTAVLETDVVSWHGTIAPSASVTINIEAEA